MATMILIILPNIMRHQTQLTSVPLLVTMIQPVLHLTMVQKDSAMATNRMSKQAMLEVEMKAGHATNRYRSMRTAIVHS
jgi:hypothetical protein